VKPETIEHIETAGRNRDLARELRSLASSLRTQPPPFEWIAVIAFYSAVHYVNALLWEQHGIAPANHTQRGGHIATLSPLTRARLEYRQVNSHAWNARYVSGYRLSETQTRDLLDANLVQVEAVVCRALGITPP